MDKKENHIRTKSFDFALVMVRLYNYLKEDKKEFIMSKQLFRSSTAIGAMVREAQQAESTADFIHKFSIALKEAQESDYWLELLHKSGYITEPAYKQMFNSLDEIIRLLTAIIKTTKANKGS